MGEYAAIEKEAKLFTELCVHNDAIDPNLFDEFGVKRGLRATDKHRRLDCSHDFTPLDVFDDAIEVGLGLADATNFSAHNHTCVIIA